MPIMPRSTGRTGLVCFWSDASKLRDVRGVGLVQAEVTVQRDMRGAGLGQHQLLLGGPGHAAKLADELPDRDAVAIGDVRGHVAAEAAFVVPVSRCRPCRQPLSPRRIRRLDVDHLLAVPRYAERQVRIEPGVAFGQFQKSVPVSIEKVIFVVAAIPQQRQFDRDPRPVDDGRRRSSHARSSVPA